MSLGARSPFSRGFYDHETTEYKGIYVSKGMITLHTGFRDHKTTECMFALTFSVVLRVVFFKVLDAVLHESDN